MSKRVVMFLVLAACGPSMKTQVKVELDPLPSNHDVKVFAEALPTCAYEDVGLIASRDLEATLDAARKMGADGVIGTVLAEAGKSPERRQHLRHSELRPVQYAGHPLHRPGLHGLATTGGRARPSRPPVSGRPPFLRIPLCSDS